MGPGAAPRSRLGPGEDTDSGSGPGKDSTSVVCSLRPGVAKGPTGILKAAGSAGPHTDHPSSALELAGWGRSWEGSGPAWAGASPSALPVFTQTLSPGHFRVPPPGLPDPAPQLTHLPSKQVLLSLQWAGQGWGCPWPCSRRWGRFGVKPSQVGGVSSHPSITTKPPPCVLCGLGATPGPPQLMCRGSWSPSRSSLVCRPLGLLTDSEAPSQAPGNLGTSSALVFCPPW